MEIILNYLPNPVLSVLLLVLAKDLDAKFFGSQGWHRLEKVPRSIQQAIDVKWKRCLEKVKMSIASISLWEILSIILYRGMRVLKHLLVAMGGLVVWIYTICKFIKTSIQEIKKVLREITVFFTGRGNRNNDHNQGGGGRRGQQRTRYRYYNSYDGVNRNTRGARNDNNAIWNLKDIITDHPYCCLALIVFAWIVFQNNI